MTFTAIDSLHIYNVVDPGVPNRERIAMWVSTPCDLSKYMMIVGTRNPDGTVFPLRDHSIWFGMGQANPGDWINLYTAPGETTVFPNLTQGALPGSKIISIHWGKGQTIFHNPALVPMLMRIDGVSCPPLQQASAQQGMLPTNLAPTLPRW